MSSSARSASARSSIVARLRASGCVFAEEEADLLIAAADGPERLSAMVERRVAGDPLEHILGWCDFAGVRVGLEPGVFVPRRRTELLVREAVRLLPPGPAIVVDLCCGSGAIGLAIASAAGGRAGRVELHASDVDPVAVRCARRNLASVGGRVYQGDLYHPLPAGLRGRIDVLTANVPYVPTGEIALLPPEARLHEPQVALDGGTDGLDLFRRVVAPARGWLAPGGHLLVEVSPAQVAAAGARLTSAGLRARLARSEEIEATVVIGTRAR